MTVDVDIAHESVGDLEISLTSPSGTKSVFSNYRHSTNRGVWNFLFFLFNKTFFSPLNIRNSSKLLLRVQKDHSIFLLNQLMTVLRFSFFLVCFFSLKTKHFSFFFRGPVLERSQ